MATCKDCVHYIACKSLLESQGYIVDGAGEDADKRCDTFADKSRFVELPCKVGDTAWVLVDQIKTPLEARVRSMLIGKDTIDFNCTVKGYYAVTVNSDDFGESFFLTREEAEAELQKRTHKPQTAPDNAEHCVCCGDVIPEGRQVCPKCEKGT